jgi:serine/threonine-protein kinase
LDAKDMAFRREVLLIATPFEVIAVAPDGRTAVIVGTGNNGYNGDRNPAEKTAFDQIEGMAVGPDGSVYLADGNNQRIRRVTVTGEVSTVAGGGAGGHIAKGQAATNGLLDYPFDVKLDRDGNLYVLDHNNSISRIGKDGIVDQVIDLNGIEGADFSADVTDFVMDAQHNFYVLDQGNSTVFKVSPDGKTAEEIPS